MDEQPQPEQPEPPEQPPQAAPAPILKTFFIGLAVLSAFALFVDYSRQQAKLPDAPERLPAAPAIPPGTGPIAPRAETTPPRAAAPRRQDMQNSRPAPQPEEFLTAKQPLPIPMDMDSKSSLLKAATAVIIQEAPEPVAPMRSPGKGSLEMLRGGAGVLPLNRSQSSLEQDSDSMIRMMTGGSSEILSPSASAAPSISYFANGGPSSFAVQVIRSRQAFDSLNQGLGMVIEQRIDFKTAMAVALCGGDMPKGWKLTIESAREEKGRFKVRYRKEKASAAELSSFESHSHAWRPVHVIVVPRSTLPAVHEELR